MRDCRKALIICNMSLLSEQCKYHEPKGPLGSCEHGYYDAKLGITLCKKAALVFFADNFECQICRPPRECSYEDEIKERHNCRHFRKDKTGDCKYRVEGDLRYKDTEFALCNYKEEAP